MPPPDPTPDPNAPGGIQGLLGNLFPGNDPAALYGGQLTDPAFKQQMAQRGLLAMAGSFADSAMPTRMPTPLGAVLGHAAAALGTSGDAVMAARLQSAQAQQELAQSQLTKQKVDMGPRLFGLLQNYDADGGGGGAPPTIPGTIGTPTALAATVATGSGPPGVTIPPGTPTATFDPKLPGTENINNLIKAAAPIALPPGYTIKMTSSGGYRPGAIAPGGGPSQHATANAADFQIFKPDGTPIPNTGEDSSTLYGRVALRARMIADPAIKPWLAWGGNFSTAKGERDLMHFDFAGDRGHFGTLGAMEQQLIAAQKAPPGPVKVASAAPPTATDAGPPGAPPGLLGPSGRTISQLADQAMADRPPFPGGLLGPPPTFRPVTVGASTLAPSGEARAPLPPPLPPGGPAPNLVPEMAPGAPSLGPNAGLPSPNIPLPPVPRPAAPPPAPPAAPPTPLVTPPPPAAAVPPAARPQQAAPPPATPAATAPAPGGFPGAPSPQKIRQAKEIAGLSQMLGYPVRPDIAETASWDIKTAEAVRDAQIKLGSTALAVRPGGGVSIGGAAPSWYAPTPTTVFNPATGRPETGSAIQRPGGGPPVVSSSGVPSGPSSQETSFGTATGTNVANLSPTNPMVGPAPPGPAPATTTPAAAAAGKPTASPYGWIPPASEERLPASAEQSKALIPLWAAHEADWAKALPVAQQAEQRMMTIADAFKSIQSGTWASQKAELTAALSAIGINIDPSLVNDPAKVQVVLHENVLSTLPLLKAATARPTQTEFAVTRENREGPNIQPAANLQMLAEDIALLRQAQNLPQAWYRSGWQNPFQFEAAYYRNNPIGTAVEAVKNQIGQLKGMPGWVPPDLPAGTKPGGTSQGKPFYILPDGTRAWGK
jgi:hypothetical protein